jgi:hypothetical protein
MTGQRHRMAHRFLALAMAFGLLVACVAGSGGIGGSTISVLQGALKIAPPMGYCVDSDAGQEGEDTAVILMGRCSSGSNHAPALISVSIGPSGSAGIMVAGGENLAAFFTSPEGRATLSRRGRSADMRVAQALSSDKAFLMRLQEAGEPSYWRAVFGLRGRLVTVSVKGGGDTPLEPEAGRKLTDRAVDALIRANRA